ncbi:recombinase family protein [Chryseobacterium lathyri]|uniref:recombinase family protein n=1 Tax=Chryseobacterium lathyri TaxID=395933 RepID=UPI0027827000|nr:recombinase family protein [Chryseobacterium lathyri]MDQ0066955.1 DNA invertase Pin-like site-specific DNA recombinase [Chryseobacterium lathyri]
MKARYIRVSTGSQNIARQEERQAKGEKIFTDVVSGSTPFKDREQGKELIKAIEREEINYVSVSSIDRLGRNLYDILTTLEFFKEKGVILKVDNLGIESLIKGKENQAFKLIISVMANIAEMEREAILERQREGIALAKARGTYKGREKGSMESVDDFLSKYKEVIKSLKKGNSIRDTAKICSISIGTVQKVKNVINNSA